MRPQRWLLLGLVAAWSLSHAVVHGDPAPRPATRSTAEKVRLALEQPITLDYVGQSLHAALEHIADKAGLPISIDQLALQSMGILPEDETGRFHVKAKDEKIGTVLRRLLGGYRLTYAFLDDTLLVTTEDAAVQRLLRQQVDLDLTDVPLTKAVRELGRRHGVNVVIDPRVAKLAQAPVTVQLDGVGLETAVRLMAEIADLKSVRLNNVLFITTDERATRIRREEASTPDAVPFAPAWPGAPGGPAPAVGNAVPARPAPPEEKKDAPK